MKNLAIFVAEDDGAITVDWVVLAAAIVGLAIATMLSIGNGTKNLADAISGEIATMSVWTF